MIDFETVLSPSTIPQKLEGLDFLEQLVDIDSQTKNITGVNRVQKLLARSLSDMGFECNFIPNLESETGDLLYAFKKGKTDEQISFIGHADTVCSPSEEFHFKINYAAQTISGPGIGDDKGSLVMALQSLKAFFAKNPVHHFTYVFLSSPCEETGSIGFHSIFKEVGEKSKIVFGLEPALFNGSLISSRNGNRWYKINIQGRSGHAGRFGEPFVNAAHHASEFIYKVSSLNDIENKVKVNVGSMRGGMDRYNVICESMEIKLDTRFPTLEKRDHIDQTIKSLIDSSSVHCFYTKEECKTTLEIVDDCPPLPLNEEIHPLLKKYVDVIAQIEDGKECELEHSGGAADINYFTRPGLVYVDGLGPKTRGMHTSSEVMDLKSFYTRQYALTEILDFLNKAPSLTGESYDN
jgi:glutamate carboxypeptidase